MIEFNCTFLWMERSKCTPADAALASRRAIDGQIHELTPLPNHKHGKVVMFRLARDFVTLDLKFFHQGGAPTSCMSVGRDEPGT